MHIQSFIHRLSDFEANQTPSDRWWIILNTWDSCTLNISEDVSCVNLHSAWNIHLYFMGKSFYESDQAIVTLTRDVMFFLGKYNGDKLSRWFRVYIDCEIWLKVLFKNFIKWNELDFWCYYSYKDLFKYEVSIIDDKR